MQYKPLSDPQPPLPPGVGIVCFEHIDTVEWFPVKLAAIDEFHQFDYFLDPYDHGHVFLSYKDRRKAIGYLWRRHRRGDLEYSLYWHGPLVDGKRWHLDYCSRGITGNLYQRVAVKVAEAAERLMIPKSFILKLIKEQKIEARLYSSKERHKGRDYFSNYYMISLAHLEAYLDHHGYGKDYPSMAERQRELGETRQLPRIVWCV